MAYTTISNKKTVSATLHFTSSNSTLVIAGNNSVSNVAISTETLSGVYIAQAVWGCDGNGHIQVLRGANLVAVYDSTGQHDYSGCGMPLNAYSAADLTVNFVGSANGFLVIELQKIGANLMANSDYFRG